MSAEAEIIECKPRELAPETRPPPLHHAVEIALKRYLHQLDGQEPDNLYRMVISQVELPLLQCVAEYCEGNQSKAARVLGLNRATLRKKLREHSLVT
ncbi:MAG: Fis family transcriptional regulator [Gammaproteobacteria bacterium]|nr:Fis family transcriptional regulator [Gammaproteobacteria bacterium]